MLRFATAVLAIGVLCSCGGGEDTPPNDAGDSGRDGAMPDGGRNDGTMPDGGRPDGTMPDGAMPDGAMPDGAMPDGTMPDGAMPDGAMPDGISPMDAMPDAVAPGCVDADNDGYGVDGTGMCLGPDCDDGDPGITDTGMRSCWSGTSGAVGVGACRAGVQLCAAGMWGGCSGEVVPGGEACNAVDDDCDGNTDESLGSFACGTGACAATATACAMGTLGMCSPGTPGANDSTCNGIDDDCDGLVDEDCTCVHVAPSGNDTNAVADNNATPFRSIQAAIDWAAADATRLRRICVASGASCGASTAYAAAVTMSDGISVYGRYESTGWTRCSTATTTTIRPNVAEGVRFPSSVASPTVLAGFNVERFTASTTSAITIDGAHQVTIAEVVIDNTPTVSNSYGINLINGAQATITRSSIGAGTGTAESIAIRSVGSTPTIRGNCQTIDAAGHCSSFCGASGNAIRARFTSGTGVTYGVLLDASPAAVVEQNAICGGEADSAAGVRIAGAATGVVMRANLVNVFGGATDSHGVWMEDCGGAAPWIVDNHMIAAAGDTTMTRVDGVRAIGDCHPIIDTNERITGGSEGGAVGANGVYCGANAGGVASRCAVLGNLDIEGSARGFPPTSVGVRCDDGGCLRIENNRISGRGGMEAWGVYIGASGTLISGNLILGGCAANATGLYAEGSFARIENNYVRGFVANECAVGSTFTPTNTVAMHVAASAGANEVDVHSNTLDSNGSGMCTGLGLLLDTGGMMPATSPSGVYRNNIVHVRDCGTTYSVREENMAADPRVFENDDLDPTRSPTGLYVDEGTTAATTIAAVNALSDATFTANVSFDPSFVSYPGDVHLSAGSACIGMGTSVGAPMSDFEGDPRPSPPSIGCDER